MLTAKQISVLKKSNVSVNRDLSKERILNAFKNANNEQKSKIVELSGISKSGFYKTYGSSKSVLALASVLNVSPFYFTGESDDKDCSDDMIKEFYKNCITADNKTKKVNAKAKSVKEETVSKKANKKTSVVTPVSKPVEKEQPKVSVTDEPKKTAESKVKTVKSTKPTIIDDESLVSLLRALSIRAKYGGEAEATYNAVVELLIK